MQKPQQRKTDDKKMKRQVRRKEEARKSIKLYVENKRAL